MDIMYEYMVDARKSYNEWVNVVDTYRYMYQYIQWVDIYNRYTGWLHTMNTMYLYIMDGYAVDTYYGYSG